MKSYQTTEHVFGGQGNGPTWVTDGEFWIGHHRSLGLVVVTDYFKENQANLRVYVLDQDRMATVEMRIFCGHISDEEITEYEVQTAIFGYGAYLQTCWPFHNSTSPRKITIPEGEMDSSPEPRTPSGLDPPDGWDLADGWREYGGLAGSDNH